MAGEYLGILVLMGVAGLISGGLVTVAWFLGPKKNTPYKQSPYECGMTPVGDAKERFPIKFYLVAIIFILFDIEAVFLWSFYTVFRDADIEFVKYAFVEFMLYMSTWILAYVYAIRVGAIDWDETSTVSAEKLGHPPIESPLLLPESGLVGIAGGVK